MGLTRPQRLQQARTASHNKAAALMLVSYAPLATCTLLFGIAFAALFAVFQRRDAGV